MVTMQLREMTNVGRLGIFFPPCVGLSGLSVALPLPLAAEVDVDCSVEGSPSSRERRLYTRAGVPSRLLRFLEDEEESTECCSTLAAKLARFLPLVSLTAFTVGLFDMSTRFFKGAVPDAVFKGWVKIWRGEGKEKEGKGVVICARPPFAMARCGGRSNPRTTNTEIATGMHDSPVFARRVVLD